MNDKKKVCVVHIETRRFFDECQSSYLPVMYPIFGVYSTREKAEHAVWDFSLIDLNRNTKCVMIILTQKETVYTLTCVLKEKIKHSKGAHSMA